MKHLIFTLFTLFTLTGCVTTPTNLSAVKANLYEYHDSGHYERDVTALFKEANSYIRKNHKNVSMPAIVMDIDETSLSNWPELKANDLTFKMEGPCNHLPKGPCGLDAYQRLANSAVMPGALELFREARRNNIAVFFITGRKEYQRAATAKNLRKAGYRDWQGLILRPVHSQGPAADYKAPEREKIEQAGYTIIATIGDQQSDLDGGHSGKTFLVPNPYYGLP